MIATIPQLSIEIAGQDAPELFITSIQEIIIRNELSCPSLCHIDLLIQQNDWSDLVQAGVEISISLFSDSSNLFSGSITSLQYDYLSNGEARLYLRAYDDLFKLSQSQATQVYENTPLNSIFEEKASSLGLNIQNNCRSVKLEHETQYNLSDLDFLKQLSRQWGSYFYLEEQSLKLINLSSQSDPLQLELGLDLISLEVHHNCHTHTRQLDTSGWSPRQVDFRIGSSSESLSQSLHSDQNLNSSGLRQIDNLIFEEDEQAQLKAQAELEYQNARESYLNGTVIGNSKLNPGMSLSILGNTQARDKMYPVYSTTHEINREKGFITTFSTKPKEKKQSKQNLNSTLAVVSAVNDPQNQGRLQVRYGGIQDLESQWMPVLLPGAGPNKGICALPTVDDKVLVVFLEGHPSQGIILGGLYDGAHLPENGADSAEIQAFSFFTGGGQKVILDDKNKKILLENEGGSKVEMSPQKMLLQSAVPFEISAPGKGITIKGSTIDFMKG